MLPNPERDERNLQLLDLIRLLRTQEARLRLDTVSSYEDAEALVGGYTSSYSRLGMILELHWALGEADFLRLLGEFWEVCDNIGHYVDDLRDLLPAGPSREMMTEAEWIGLMALPSRKRITVYRGADAGINEHGLCWTLERSVAARFPFLNRYRAKDPVLVTATVRRSQITALKLGREESEIITLNARVVRVEPLAANGHKVDGNLGLTP